MKILVVAVLALAAILPALAHTVSVTLLHARAATDAAISYTGACKEGTYELRLSHQRDQVHLNLDAGAIVTLNLSDAPFGKTFVHEPLVGTFVFACLRDELQVAFYGFDVREGQAKPVSYGFTVGFKGDIRADHGLKGEQLDVVAGHYIAKAQH